MGRGIGRGSTALLASVLLALVACGTAQATWSPGSAGSGVSAATSMGLPQAPNATATSSSSISVVWSAPGGPSPAQYVVRRTAPTTATVCTVGAPTHSCTDSGLNPSTSYTYTVEARLAGWTSGPTGGFSASTPTPTFMVAPAAGTHSAGTSFSVVLTATTNGVTKDTSYSGAHVISFSGPSASPSGDVPTYPATVTFAGGLGTASVTLVDAESTTIVATDGVRTGSAPVTIGPGPSEQLAFTSSTPSCASGSVQVGLSGTFTSNVSVLDHYGNPVPQSATAFVSLRISPSRGSLSPSSVSVAAGASESSSPFVYQRPPRGATSVDLTASSPGLTSRTCTVQR